MAYINGQSVFFTSSGTRVSAGGETQAEWNADTKADKVTGATANDIAGLDANGNLIDLGFSKNSINSLSNLPKLSKISITAPANGKSYTPTQNGWIGFKGTAETGGFVELGTWGSNGLETRCVASSNGGGVAVYLPVRAGDTCYFYYNSVSSPEAVFVAVEGI